MGADNYNTLLTEPKKSWKDVARNRYIISVQRFTSLKVVAHDLEVCGARILETFNVLHGFLIEANSQAMILVPYTESLLAIERAENLKALHG